MGSVALIPKQAAIAVADMVDNCAKVKPGMNVVIGVPSLDDFIVVAVVVDGHDHWSPILEDLGPGCDEGPHRLCASGPAVDPQISSTLRM